MDTRLPRLPRVCLVIVGILLAGCPGPVQEHKLVEEHGPEPSLTPILPTVSSPTASPETFIPSSRLETARLFNGIRLHSSVTTLPGSLAVLARKEPDSYTLELNMNIEVPKAAQTIDEVETPDPSLSLVLPWLKQTLPSSKVSSFYFGLYQLKMDAVNRNIGRLDQIMSRHNFFDCNTILEIEGEKTKRRALLIQSDMDVNADGSDADRFSQVDATSANFQPFTSYRWPKRSDNSSQFLQEREDRLKQLQTEFQDKTIQPDKKKILQDQIDAYQREVNDLKRFSFLIAKIDPYIVLPGFMLRQFNHPFAPKLGDYVVVVYKGKLYPALLGDVGPSYKIGEASLRICTQIDPRANPYNRPASDLNITYLVFPNSADGPPAPPDLKKMRDRCTELLNEIGGFAGDLWTWEDLASPSASPAPSPSQPATN